MNGTDKNIRIAEVIKIKYNKFPLLINYKFKVSERDFINILFMDVQLIVHNGKMTMIIV